MISKRRPGDGNRLELADDRSLIDVPEKKCQRDESYAAKEGGKSVRCS